MVAAKKVTIRHLCTHTSGLGYGFTSAITRDFKPRDGEKYVNRTSRVWSGPDGPVTMVVSTGRGANN